MVRFQQEMIEKELTPSILRRSDNAVDPGPRNFAHLASSQSNLDAKGAQMLALPSENSCLYLVYPGPESSPAMGTGTPGV